MFGCYGNTFRDGSQAGFAVKRVPLEYPDKLLHLVLHPYNKGWKNG